MSAFYLILALVFSLVIAIFAIANTEPVTVNYIFGREDVSLVILILGSAFAGALVMGLISLFRSIRTALAFRQARQERTALQRQISELEEEKVFLQAELNKALSVHEEDEGDEEETARIEPEPGQAEPGDAEADEEPS